MNIIDCSTMPLRFLELFNNCILRLFVWSVVQSCLILCHPKDCSTPGFPVLHYLRTLHKLNVHWVGDDIQPFHPLSSPLLAFNLSQHQGLFQWVSSFFIVQLSAFFIVQLSHPYITTGKTIALTRQTFAGKVMSLLFNMLSRLVIVFLLRSKRLLT